MSAGGLTGVTGYSDALSRMTQIQDQIASMRTAFTGASATSATSGGAAVTATASAPTGSADSTFADQLASALSDGSSTTATSDSAGSATALDGILGSSGLSGLTSPTGLTGTAATGVESTATLPANATSMLTSDQQQFAARLASDTGLDPGVVSAWLLAEENGAAATTRQSQDNNDWLNIGYTDSGTYGSEDSVWSDPTTAADATAGWLKGQDTIPGYGTASAGIQSIAATAGQSPAAQIAALQSSGWASSGYPDLGSVYAEVTA